jgi:hypothetical protein
MNDVDKIIKRVNSNSSSNENDDDDEEKRRREVEAVIDKALDSIPAVYRDPLPTSSSLSSLVGRYVAVKVIKASSPSLHGVAVAVTSLVATGATKGYLHF